MRRRTVVAGPLQPMPTALVGVGVVEDWVEPGEASPDLPVDDGPRAALGDSRRAYLARLLAERRLEQAREEWRRDHRPYIGSTDVSAISARRPPPGPVLAAQVEILERRRWVLAPARCDFRDRAAYDRRAAR